MLDFKGLRGSQLDVGMYGTRNAEFSHGLEPTTDLDEKGAAGDRLGAPADGGLGMDPLASGADQPAALSADEIERIVQSRHDAATASSVRSPPEAGSGPPCARSCRTPDASSCACSENSPPSTTCIERTR